MGYVVVVFAMVNVAAILAVGYYLRILWRELPMYLTTAIQDEVRKQDDRIEKRVAKIKDPAVNAPEELGIGPTDGLIVGRPYRRPV